MTKGRKRILALRLAVSMPAMAISSHATAQAVGDSPRGQDAAVQPATAGDNQNSPMVAASSAQSPADEIVVTGFRKSLASAIQIKKNADQIVDSIAAEDIGKLPDNNISEALQRVPGVQITRNHGEGSGIAIRGLTQVKTLLDGREIFSDNGRDLSLENVPAEILAGIDVYKNPSAKLIEGGLGGVINLKTRQPFDFPGFEASVSAGMDYYDLAGKSRPQISALISDRFDTGLGEIGVLVGAAVIQSVGRLDQNGAEPFNDRCNITDYNGNGVFIGKTSPNDCSIDPGDTVISPNGGGNSVELTDRDRVALNGAVQWRPSSNLDLYLQGTYNKYKYQQDSVLAYANRGSLFAAPNAPFTFNEGTNVVKAGAYRDVVFTSNTNYFDRNAVTWQIAGGGHWHVTPRFELDTDISYTRSRRTDNGGGLRSGNPDHPQGTTLNFDTSTDLVTLDLTGFDFGNRALYSFIDSSTSIEKATSKGFAAREDATYSFDGSVLKSIEAGLRYEGRDVYRQQGTQNHFTGNQPSSLYPGALAFSPYAGNFFRGTDIPNPINQILVPTPAAVRDTQAICAAFGDMVCYPTFNPNNTYSQNEKTYAGYVVANFDFSVANIPVDGNIGGRYVRTDLSTDGVITAPTGETSPINETNSYGNFLPSANLRFKITPDLFFRLAAAKQLTRPNFSSLSPTLNVSSASASGVLSINAGNPELRPLKSTSYDASIEYYFSRSGYAYLDGFLKKVDGFVQNVVSRETVNLPQYPQYDQADINRPENGKNGTIKGFELGTQTFFDFLPAPLDGFGIQANYTYVESSAPGPIVGQSVPLQGLSKNSYNLVGFFEKSGFRARVAYNWRSDFVESTSGPGSGSLPIYDRPFDELDASVGYSVNDHFDISVDATNITNSVTRSYFGETIRPRFNNIFDRRIGITVRVKT